MNASKLLTTIAAACMSFSVLAISLDDAKSQGLVGETATGYLGVIKGSSEVNKLVDEVNSKRKAKYQQLAKKNGISLSQVEVMAAKKTFAKTAPGHFVKVDGKWVKK
ncbi:YdbL family protein [Pseudoalteromonas sp. OOF1S-7]|uniref:YdbL family protein n=1 Tax=Pseudoalteromonas sp. OOF1S-7 TaxID=2917757 RepID=UPI001EF42970|nr:YdbL family protein [Pseudoalteromonas sp. OOF1S-7]MCG7535251.1 YdbL family protein [Pseudoalteromonas sp. OOF1S-7]